MIVGILGNLGRGKTLSMTFLVGYFLDNSKIDYVVSNYETDFTTHYVQNEKELDNISNQDFTAIYALDEIWAWINSREAMENFDMIEFVLNSRKRGAFIIYTTQKTSQVDPILVENTDYLVVPIHKEKIENSYEYDTVTIYFLKNESYEVVNSITFNAEAFYGSYDTSEEVAGMSDSEKFEELIEDMYERTKGGEFENKTEIKSYLQLHHDVSINKSKAIADDVFRRVKAEKSIEENSDSGQKKLNI